MSNDRHSSRASSATEALCLQCGLCCDGTIFADVKLQAADDDAQLRSLGLPIGRARKFPQPCPALDGCRCQIYRDRPRYCRDFECLLLKRVLSSRLESAAALNVIRDAREKSHLVRTLLDQLGEDDSTVALSIRFRRLTKRLQKKQLAADEAAIYGQLTLAMHELNLLLGEMFYPGALGSSSKAEASATERRIHSA